MVAAAGMQPVEACDLYAIYAATEAKSGNGKGCLGGVANGSFWA
jgi:hypothetical protein